MFHIKLAGHTFTVDNHFPYVETLCADYIAEEKGRLITVSEQELEEERQAGEVWPAGYLESLAVYRKICRCLLEQNIILFHCSALEFGQEGYLFAAPSGTGKSTHARLWREYFGAAVKMINDDKPLLHIAPGAVTVYGTPYGGKERLQTNTSAPVKGIMILHQTAVNQIKILSPHDAYPLLLNQTYRPKDPSGLLRTLELVRQLARLPVYSLGCTISGEAVEMAYEALTGKQIESYNTSGEKR